MLLVVLAFGFCAESAQAQFYRPGQILPDFTVYMRRPWTNHVGKVFGVGAPIRLIDFTGTVLFLKFFDPS
jgi:hypothetical protein